MLAQCILYLVSFLASSHSWRMQTPPSTLLVLLRCSHAHSSPSSTTSRPSTASPTIEEAAPSVVAAAESWLTELAKPLYPIRCSKFLCCQLEHDRDKE
uniref:Secreted protein n=1 Tax=Zea mays TaxID=4577 RepID=C0PLN6_MAIZE|nr:unknown [Zea mays]